MVSLADVITRFDHYVDYVVYFIAQSIVLLYPPIEWSDLASYTVML